MSSLIGFNIGGNPRGILNIGSTINTPLDATLRAVTDGLGNASPLQLSTSQVSNVFTGSHTILWRANGTLTDYSGWHQNDGTFVILKKDGNPLWFNIDSAVNFSSGFGSTGRSSINAAGNWTIGGAFTNAARLHVRGDGTNPIARFEDNAGTARVSINSSGVLICTAANNEINSIRSNNTFAIFQPITISGANNVLFSWGEAAATIAGTSGTLSGHSTIVNLTSGAGSANKRVYSTEYTINNSGAQTGTATGFFLNATETALNGMTHNLMDLQVGGVSRFRVGAQGNVTSSGSIGLFNYSGYFQFISAGGALISAGTYESVTAWTIDGGGAFLLRLRNSGVERLTVNNVGTIAWGTTNAFPALKRNGAALEVRLADDSGFAGLSASSFIANVNSASSVSYGVNGATNGLYGAGGNSVGISTAGVARVYIDASNINFASALCVSNAATNTANASAILQADSTTRGFLPPRQTEAQRLAISSPAVGLIVYQTDATDGLYVYKTGGWTLIA